MEKQLKDFILQMGDNALVLGHRLSEWCGHGPELEQDIALTNIALDLIGQTRLYYQHLASEEEGKGEDDYAYKRDTRAFRNLLLTEYENTDFAYTIARSFLFDHFHYLLLQQLTNIEYTPIKNIANQAIKEVQYHRTFSSDWMIRLGDGTEESHRRIQEALEDLWTYTGEMFEMSVADQWMTDFHGINMVQLKSDWDVNVNEVLSEATLERPESAWMQSGGKKGIHTEQMGFLLAEMQFLQRAYPNNQW